MLDITMLGLLAGRERTADEFGALFSGAGLRVTRIIPTESPSSIIEGVVA
jgi:hypothetical protein